MKYLLITSAIKERFWSKVDKSNSCWEYRGSLSRGYGYFWIKNRLYSAHRVSWIIKSGNIPEGLYVCHKCDNKKCVKPTHLFLGTQRDNLQDASKKGRIAQGKRHMSKTHPESVARGEKVHSSKLTKIKVLEIRKMYNSGRYFQRELGQLFNVNQVTIHDIIRGLTWKHL